MAAESTIVRNHAKPNSGLRVGYSENSNALPPRIALLTPYSGGNLGDAAIQDAMIANLRNRFPGALFSGISLNSINFLQQHGLDAFPLCATRLPFYGMSHEEKTDSNNSRSASHSEGVKPAMKS